MSGKGKQKFKQTTPSGSDISKMDSAVSSKVDTTDNDSTRILKKITVYVLAIVLLIFVKKQNDSFFSERIHGYWEAYNEQKADLDVENRKLSRYGSSYYYCTIIAKMLKEQKASPEDVVLMPSTEYFKSTGLDFGVPEPAVLYYLAGFKSNWQDFKLTPMPKWFCTHHNGQFILQKINNKTELDSILKILKPYPSHL